MSESRSVPEKFEQVAAPITSKVDDSTSNSAISTITAFPADIDFNGKKDEENVVLLVRRSPYSMLWKFFAFFGLLVAPLFFIIVIQSMDYGSGSMFGFSFGISLFFLLLALTFGVDTYVKWFYSVNIITDERIVDVDFTNILYHRYSEASLEHIQDVTHTVNGVLGSLFDYGTVYIQTAASRPEFEFENVPKPREVQEVLVNLLEMKERGDI